MALHSHRDGLLNPSPGFCVWDFCNRLFKRDADRNGELNFGLCKMLAVCGWLDLNSWLFAYS